MTRWSTESNNISVVPQPFWKLKIFYFNVKYQSFTWIVGHIFRIAGKAKNPWQLLLAVTSATVTSAAATQSSVMKFYVELHYLLDSWRFIILSLLIKLLIKLCYILEHGVDCLCVRQNCDWPDNSTRGSSAKLDPNWSLK